MPYRGFSRRHLPVLLAIILFVIGSRSGICDASGNLVQNANFSDASFAPWERWQSTSDTAYIEQGLLVIKTNNYWQVVQQTIPYNPGRHYLVTFSAQTAANTRLTAVIQDWNSGTTLGSISVPANSLWGTSSFCFTAPTQTDHRLSIRFYPSDRFAVNGKVQIDDVQVSDVTSMNSISNGQFNLIPSWERWQSTLTTAYIEDGSLAIETNVSWQVVQQTLTYQPDGNYTLTFRAETNAKTGLTAAVCDWTTGTTLGYATVPGNSTWRSCNLNFKAPVQSGHRVLVRFYPSDRLAVGGKVRVDDVHVLDSKLQNAILNGGFDSISPWERWQSTPQTAYVEKDRLSIRTNDSWQVVQQTLSYEPGRNYLVSFKAQTDAKTRLTATILDWTSGKTLGILTIPQQAPWSQYSFNFTGPVQSRHRISVRFHPTDRLAVNGEVGIRDVSVTAMEPSVFMNNGTFYYPRTNLVVNEELGIRFENAYSWSLSPNGLWSIYADVHSNNAPDVFVRSDHGITTRLTQNNFIEFNPVINNNGDYAYALSENSTSESKVYLNGQLVPGTDNHGLYANLSMNDSFLSFSYVQLYSDLNYLFTYNLNTKSTKMTLIHGYIQKLAFINNGLLLIQIFDPKDLTMHIYTHDPITSDLVKLEYKPGNQFVEVQKDGTIKVDIVSGDEDALLLHNALYAWKNYQIANPFAYSNNFLGRISWNQSYLLEGLISLFRITGSSVFHTQINNVIDSLLKRTNSSLLPGNPELPPYLWATKKLLLEPGYPPRPAG